MWRVFAALCLFAAPPRLGLAQASVIEGTVLASHTGRPIVGASVRSPAVQRETRTDSLGRFRLEKMPAGALEVQVQAVGFAPLRAVVQVLADSTLTVDVDLEPLTPQLARVVTTADRSDARNLNYADFERRRASAIGKFISRSELLAEAGRSLESVLSARLAGTRVWDFNGKRVLGGSSRGPISVLRGDQRCFVQVIVDNVLRYQSGGSLPPFDLRSLDPAMIAGVEFYTVSSTPSEFNRGGNAPCGTLVLWLQN